MNLSPRRPPRSAFSSELHQRAGSEEEAIRFAKIGLLIMQVTSLEKEVADLAERIEASRKRIKELPCKIERREKSLAEAIVDQKMLENLESRK